MIVKFCDPRDLEFNEKNNTNPMNLKINKEERDREEFTPQEWMYSQYLLNMLNYNEINPICREELILSLIIIAATKSNVNMAKAHA